MLPVWGVGQGGGLILDRETEEWGSGSTQEKKAFRAVTNRSRPSSVKF